MTATLTTATYVFGIVEAGTPVPAGHDRGLARELRLVEAGGLAALVARINTTGRLGRAADLRAHNRVLADLVAAGRTVLPMRFGAVLTDDGAVVSELLMPHQQEFRDDLARLQGRVQYSLTVRYREETVLAEIVADEPEIRRLRAATATNGDPALRLRLGELVVRALEQRRGDHASAVLAALPGVVDLRLRDTTSPEDVLDVAFLVDARRGAAFEAAAERVAAGHATRLRLSLTGPSAAYDFIGGH